MLAYISRLRNQNEGGQQEIEKNSEAIEREEASKQYTHSTYNSSRSRTLESK
jgi:hypothetical protein